MFLIFEDRKFGDIGIMARDTLLNCVLANVFFSCSHSTVQSQCTRGPFSIGTWAHLTNAHLFPGPSIISTLHSVATATLTSLNQSVFTEITTGTPCGSFDSQCSGGKAAVEGEDDDSENSDNSHPPLSLLRKGSVVAATTTISQIFEPTPPTF